MLESKWVLVYMRIVQWGWGNSEGTLIFQASTGWCWARWYWWKRWRCQSESAIFKNYSSWCIGSALSQALLFSAGRQTPLRLSCPPTHGWVLSPVSPLHPPHRSKVTFCWALAVLPQKWARSPCFWCTAGSRTSLWGPLYSAQGPTILTIFWSSCLGRLKAHWSSFWYPFSLV